jgi:hypothetical protein
MPTAPFEPPTMPPRCDAPALLERTAEGGITVAWGHAAGVTAMADAYELEWAPAVAGRAPAWEQLAETAGRHHALPPLPPGAAHAFRVRARHADSGAWGPWSKPSPPFAAAPPLAAASAGR